VVAIHCKAGKGRTGFLISCLLVFLGIHPLSVDAIKHFSTQRTQDGKALNQPSQRLYVRYWQFLAAARCCFVVFCAKESDRKELYTFLFCQCV